MSDRVGHTRTSESYLIRDESSDIAKDPIDIFDRSENFVNFLVTLSEKFHVLRRQLQLIFGC